MSSSTSWRAVVGAWCGDLLVALLALAGAGLILGGVVESDWFPLGDHLLSRWGYPELRLVAATAVLVVAGPELVRGVRNGYL